MGDVAGEVASPADPGWGRSPDWDLASGLSHTCALPDDGKLYAPRPLSLPWILAAMRQAGVSARRACLAPRGSEVEEWRKGGGWLGLPPRFVALSV